MEETDLTALFGEPKAKPAVKKPDEPCTYKQSKLFKAMYGLWAPKTMSRGLCSHLIDLGKAAEADGKDNIAEAIDGNALLLAFTGDKYVEAWVNGGMKLVSPKPAKPTPPEDPDEGVQKEYINVMIADPNIRRAVYAFIATMQNLK